MTDVFQAEYDVRLLKDIQESVESLYEDGQPLHYLESAMSVDYDPNDARVSSIFVVDCAKFKKMQGPQIQDIFKHRHILVHGVEVRTWPLTNRVSLPLVGCMSAALCMVRVPVQH